jgi:hypothetical protein
MTPTAVSSVGTWRNRWRWVTRQNEHGNDVVVEPWSTFLPHIRHHRVLVLFVITGLDTVLHHDCQWNEPAMGNSVAAAGAMKAMSSSRR